MTEKVNISKCINHYIMMRRVQKAGGLRKELTPEICVSMHITWTYPDISPLESIIIANQIKNIVIEMESIPF